jgi:predicted N-formylglutamate amidohydrolase
MQFFGTRPNFVTPAAHTYSMPSSFEQSDATDYTIPVHGERHGLPHALIEIRQDLIADEGGQQQWAERLARLLPRAYDLSAAGN